MRNAWSRVARGSGRSRAIGHGTARTPGPPSPVAFAVAVAFAAFAFVAIAVRPAFAQSGRDMNLAAWQKQKAEVLFDAGQRHLQLGSWARKAKLVPQATTQFLRAVEVSEGKNQGAQTVLAYMRGLGPAFWKGERQRPPRALLDDYARRAAKVEEDDRRERIELLLRAAKLELANEWQALCMQVAQLGADLTFDAKGQARLDGKLLPEPVRDWLVQQTLTVNADQRRVELAGPAAPRLPNVTEFGDPWLVVRTDLPGDTAKELHALGLALLPHLRERLDGTPTRQLVLFVFAKRADYDAYLDALHLGAWKGGSGLAEYGTFQTLVSAEGKSDDDLRATVLHELAHLGFWGTAPAAMPDWYAEGFAESFGGQGTFAWDGTKLTIGGVMARHRIEAVQKEPLPLAELFAGDAARLLATEPDKGHRFYAQAWALHRFLTTRDTPWTLRFREWEARCRGAVLGAEPGKPRGSEAEARMLWDEAIRADLPALEAAFRDWLATL